MPVLTAFQWALIALLIGFYILLCGRTALYMARTGRSFWKWLVISVLFTSIPASLVMLRQQMKAHTAGRRFGRDGQRTEGAAGPQPLDEAPVRCRHCGKRIRPADLDQTGGLPTCPFCHLPIDQEKLG